MPSSKTHTLVIKLGTSVLTQGTKQINKAHVLELVRQCAIAHQQGHRIIIVTSGAIAAGREHLKHPQLPPTIASRQLLASVGQSKLIQLWEQLFSLYNIHVGQMLLTRADLEDRERFLNARDMLSALLAHGIIPIINENDAVATSEIKVGDNDNLSALVAILANAKTLLLLTDQHGVFTHDPRYHPEAELIRTIPTIDARIYALASGSTSGLGTGGMTTKIQAAEVATRSGINVVIASGSQPDNIQATLSDSPPGTFFPASPSPLETRKHWLFGPPSSGKIHIDAGAAKALLHHGASLLPKGITRIEGLFVRGAVVRIIDPEKNAIAYGVACYSSEDVQRIAGLHSDAIAGILGYTYGPVVIHRDDCVITAAHANNEG